MRVCADATCAVVAVILLCCGHIIMIFVYRYALRFHKFDTDESGDLDIEELARMVLLLVVLFLVIVCIHHACVWCMSSETWCMSSET